MSEINSSPTLLAFDTSGPYCAVAVMSQGRITTRIDNMTRGQAEHLFPLLQEVLEDHQFDFSDLDGIGVGIGPGNFTGIRIAVSAARGLTFALNTPAVGVSTLEALVWDRTGPRLAVLDAPRDHIYAQLFGVSQSHPPQHCTLTKKSLESIVDGYEPIVIGPNPASVLALTGWACRAPRTSIIEAIIQIAKLRLPHVSQPPRPLYMRPADAKPNPLKM